MNDIMRMKVLQTKSHLTGMAVKDVLWYRTKVTVHGQDTTTTSILQYEQ